jgi:hypothetical protein
VWKKLGQFCMCTISYSIPRWRTAISCGVSAEARKWSTTPKCIDNGWKTDLIERCILHRKPKHTIYVRYFSILLYLLNVQVAPIENKTSLKLVDAFRRSRSFSSFGTYTTDDRSPPSWNQITDSTHAPPVGNVGGWTPFTPIFWTTGPSRLLLTNIVTL